MKDEEVREFLMRWLMEFGTELIDNQQRRKCLWYMKGAIPIDAKKVHNYFDGISDGGRDAYQLNQAGLDFIKEK